MAPTLAKHDEWTVADLDALDVEDWWRYEIVDGALVVSPAAGLDHERVSALLRAALWAAQPEGLMTVGPVGVAVGRSHLVPDLALVRRDSLRGEALLAPADVSLVVEIVSPGSRSMDRITKPALYAQAGIANFWRVETDPVALTAYALANDTYRELGTWHESAILEQPFPVTIDLTLLR